MKTTIAAFLVLAMACSAYSDSVESVVHGQPHQTIDNKMRAIVLVAAPLLDHQVNVLDIFPWLEDVTRQADPDGTGIRFEVRVDDPRPLEARNTMDKWKDHNSGNASWPQMRRSTVEEYLVYLSKMAGLTYTISDEKVMIERAYCGIEQTSPAAPPEGVGYPEP